MRGLAYFGLGQTERAIQDFDQAIRLDPSWGTPYDTRSDAYRRLGKTKLAEADRDKACQLRADYCLPDMTPTPAKGLILPTMLPTLDDLSAGFSIIDQGLDPETSNITKSIREFGAAKPGAPLGQSLVTTMQTGVDLYETEGRARFVLSMVQGFGPQFFAELFAAGLTKESNTSFEATRYEAVEHPALGDYSLAFSFSIASADSEMDFYLLSFSRATILATVRVGGPKGQVALEDILPIAQLMLKRIDDSLAAR